MAWRSGVLTVGAVLFALAMTVGSPSGMADDGALKIGDGSDWLFVASKWQDTEAGEISGSRSGDGVGLQGYSMAFYKPKSYSDVEAEFTVCMPTNHADIGLIVRAQDPTHFYVIHFPQCGQAYRAQHFWAALSKADGSGYLRVLKLAHVRRVASNPFGQRHKARVQVTGDRFQVWLNGHPALDVRDDTYKAGRIGLAGFVTWSHGKVTVKGTEVEPGSFDDSIPQVKNWFLPFPDTGGRQDDAKLSKTPGGDLLCTLQVDGQKRLARSKDEGKTWTVAEPPPGLSEALGKPEYYTGDIQLLSDGRLVAIGLSTAGGAWTESKDDGQTWSEPLPIKTEGWPTDPEKISTGYMLQLSDGTLIRFGLGRHSTWTDPITKWGAVHCQAFSVRSTDDGKTWSTPVNLDGSKRDDMGNLDLTEPVGFETADGKIMCLIRPIYSPWMWETWSHDKGQSWTPCVRGPMPGYAPCAMVKTASGVAMFATRFPGLTVHTTADDGMTWDGGGGGTYIDTSIWAMGSMLEVEPNLVLYMYWDSWRSKLRAQFIRVTPEGLQPARDMMPQ